MTGKIREHEHPTELCPQMQMDGLMGGTEGVGFSATPHSTVNITSRSRPVSDSVETCNFNKSRWFGAYWFGIAGL